MHSMGLMRFVSRYGLEYTAGIMDMTKQGVSKAMRSGRNIQIVDTGKGYIEARESKVLSKIKGSFPEDK